MRILLDTNVIIDVLQKREPWFQDSLAVSKLIAGERATGCITAKQAADIYFYARKQFRGETNVDRKAREVMKRMFSLFELIDTLRVDCLDALDIANNDYEDAILIAGATRSGVDCIVTRNQEHFRASPIPVYSPNELLTVIEQDK